MDHTGVKTEFPPLLAPGMHRMQLADVWRLCVCDFPLSATRPRIMRGLERLISYMNRMGITGELWLDGSFLTQKIDPDDVDMALRLQSAFSDNVTLDQDAFLRWFADDDLKPRFYCDTYVFVEYPEDDPRFDEGDEDRRYWLGWFGRSRRKMPKGIATVQIPSDTGFRLRMMAHRSELCRVTERMPRLVSHGGWRIGP